ncbi:MAG: hypothetical protein FJW40_19330 [Acidobacteria bacterium]|nr:hypothetical protein [Acidobacteriota bacterium]
MWGGIGPDMDPLGPDGSDGFAFVVHNAAAGASALGLGAGGLGYMYIENSLAVEFDTHMNQPWYSDPNGNHIAVQSRGLQGNLPHHRCSGGRYTNAPGAYTDLPGVPCTTDAALAMVADGLPFLNDGALHLARIIYQDQRLRLHLDGRQIIDLTVDLRSLLSLHQGQGAYLGFTAGARGGYQYTDISNVDLEVVPEPSTWLLGAAGIAAGLLHRLKARA